MIGVVGYGLAIALLDARLLGSSSTWRGVLMQIVGAGMFGMATGPMTLVLHLIFSAVLGWTYGRLVAGTATD